MHEGKKRWVQTTSVHIVQASKCSRVSVCVCRVVPVPPPQHAPEPRMSSAAGSSALSGCLCCTPESPELASVCFAALVRCPPSLFGPRVSPLSSRLTRPPLLSVPCVCVMRYLFHVCGSLTVCGFSKMNPFLFFFFTNSLSFFLLDSHLAPLPFCMVEALISS